MRRSVTCLLVAVAVAACVPSDDARLDDYGRVTRSGSAEFCIVPEGLLRENADPPRLCGDNPKAAWEAFAVGECVHLYVLNPNPYGEVEDVRPSNRCKGG